MGNNRIQKALRIVGDIFVPMLPGIICAGLCGGFASLLAQVMPNYAENSLWAFLYQILTLINTAMMTYLTAWAGYRATDRPFRSILCSAAERAACWRSLWARF